MKDATTFSATQWLALSQGSATSVFTGTPEEIRGLYRRLAAHWHPDRNTDPWAKDVFVHLKALYTHALALSGGSTARAGTVDVIETLTDSQGHTFRFAGQAREAFELGTFLRGKATLAYRVDAAHQDLFETFAKHAGGLVFRDAAMRQQMEPLLPCLHAHPWGPDGGLLVLKRDPEAVRLKDLALHYLQHGTRLPAEHVAWAISGLFHLACYLEHVGLAHHGIGLDSVWVVPGKHTVHLWGGWFYAQPFGQRLVAMPAAAVDMVPNRYLQDKVAGPGVDRSLIRALGRELLGDRRGQRIPTGAAPKPFIDALLSPAGASAVEDYRAWKQVLTASFGPPKFVPMAIEAKHIYP